MARRRSSSGSSSFSASAMRSGERGGTCSPVVPSTTVSIRPPTALATTGTPQAMASSGTKPDELEHLIGAGCHHPVDGADESFLDREALGRGGVLAALMPTLDDAERVEGENDGDPQRSRRLERGQAGHPEVCVHDVGAAL